MSQENCNSCFMPYNSNDRIPLMLYCCHTYCKACIETYMFQGMQITCLSCSKVMQGVSVSSLPMNPYLKPRESISPIPSHLREDVFYSDSDEEKTSEGGADMKKNWMEKLSEKKKIIIRSLTVVAVVSILSTAVNADSSNNTHNTVKHYNMLRFGQAKSPCVCLVF